MNGEVILDYWMMHVLPMIWVIYTIGTVIYYIMWRLGKVKVTFPEEPEKEDDE